MNFFDAVRFAVQALASQRLRTTLTALGIAVGVAAVVLLTSLGSGIHSFVLGEFTQFGTNLIAISPGRASTTGVSGAVISNIRPLTLADARALQRLPWVEAVVPVVQGNAAVDYRRASRRTVILGVGASVPRAWRMAVATGQFLPPDDDRAARPFVVLGATVSRELFGTRNPLGGRVRVGGESFRVIGVMAAKGQMLGFDLDDAVYIPTGRALSLFNRESLMEIDLLYTEGIDGDHVARQAKSLLMKRHGSEDFTVVTQDQMLEVLGSVLQILTLAVGALGGISLLVGAVGILTVMTIAVRERTAEIGLLRALGAGRWGIMLLFMAEATALGAIGGLAGLVIGVGGARLLSAVVPALPTQTPWSYVAWSEIVAAVIGLGAGVLPARHAARLDPIEALRAE